MNRRCIILSLMCLTAAILVCGGASATLWPGMKSGTPLTDQQFFSAINLDLPGLETVKARVNAQDWQGAKNEFYTYIRNKFRTAQYYTLHTIVGDKVAPSNDPDSDFFMDFFIEEGKTIHNLGDPVQNLLAMANDLAVSGKIYFHSTGNLYQFDPSKPFDYIDFNPNNREYHEPMQLYAMYDFNLLRDAYFRTNNPIYLTRAKEMATSFCYWYSGGARGPYGADSYRTDYTHPWENWTLPRRIRAMVRFLTFLQKDEMEPNLVVDVMKSLLDDERLHVTRGGSWGGNWRQYMCTDGAVPAAIFYEFKDAQSWWTDQVNRILQAYTEIYADGSTGDMNSTSYGEGYALWLGVLSDMITAFNSPMRIQTTPDQRTRYEELFDWQLSQRMPNGLDVQFNDNGRSMPPSYYGRVAGNVFNYFGRGDMKWFATSGAQGSPPLYSSFPPTSTTPSYAGSYAMRSDWTNQARYLVVDFGPYGGHGHPDYGSFTLYAYGADLIDEGGCAAYGSEPYGSYSVRTAAHNIISIDGCAQPSGRPAMGTVLDNWITNAVYDYTWGQSSFGVSFSQLAGVVHKRSIYFAKPDYYLLLDRIEGSGTHTVRNKVQLWCDVSTTVQGTAVTGQSQLGASIAIMPFDVRTAPSIVTGQKSPFWEGWVSKEPHCNLVEPAPAVIYEESRTLPVSYETLLFPRPAGVSAQPTRSRLPADEGSAKGVLLSVMPPDHSYQDQIVVNYGTSILHFSSRRLTVNGQLAHLRYYGSRLTRVSFVKTSAMTLPLAGGQSTITFEVPADGYIVFGSSGTLKDATVYLDLSNRRSSMLVTMQDPGEAPVQINMPVGTQNGGSGASATGLSTTGLLVRVYGRATYVAADGSYVYLDDGTGRFDGSGRVGVRIVLAAGTASISPGSYVAATGMSSFVSDGGVAVPAVLARSASDVSVY